MTKDEAIYNIGELIRRMQDNGLNSAIDAFICGLKIGLRFIKTIEAED